MGTTMRAAVAAAVLLLVAGCSDGDPSPRDPSSTWSPTGTMETPTSAAPDPVEPELPAEAKEASEAGARAFIGYYWELINYAQVTGDVKALKAVSARTCDVCTGLASDLRDLYRSGGHLEGGANTVSIAEAATLTTKDKAAYGFRLELDIAHEPQSIVQGDGNREERAAGVNRFTAYLLWVNNSAWRTDALDLR